MNRGSCLICGSSNFEIIREEQNSQSTNEVLSSHFQVPSRMAYCPSCNYGWVVDIPGDSAFYGALYADGERDVSIDYVHSGKKKIFKEVLGHLLAFKNGGKLLDYGTGTGAFLKACQGSFEAHGVELSPATRSFGSAQGHSILASLEELPITTRFDVITLLDVLEHLPSPGLTLENALSRLKPGGYLYIKVPNFKPQIFKQNLLNRLRLSQAGVMTDYVHINHFSSLALRKFMQGLNLEPVSYGYSAPEIWDLTWDSAPKSRVYRYFYNFIVQSLSSALKALSHLLGQDMGLNIYCIARKPETKGSSGE